MNRRILISSLVVISAFAVLTSTKSSKSQYIPDPNHDCVANCDGSDDGYHPQHYTDIFPGAYVAAVCMATSHPSSTCLNRQMDAASKLLGEELIKVFLGSVAESAFHAYLPSIYPAARTAKFLFDTEMKTINLVQARIENDLGRARALEWPTEEEKRRSLLIIQNDERTIEKWNRQAREEATKGVNWSRLSIDAHARAYTFHAGPAYAQLRTIESFGWLSP